MSHIGTENKEGKLYFRVLDLKYAYSQLKLAADTARHWNFNIVGGNSTGTIRFLTWFYELADMPAEIQKAMDRTISHAKNTFCVFDDILIVSKGEESEHAKLVEKVPKNLDDEKVASKIQNWNFQLR